MPYTIPPNILKKLYSLQIRVVKFADTTGQISRYMWSNSPKYSFLETVDISCELKTSDLSDDKQFNSEIDLFEFYNIEKTCKFEEKTRKTLNDWNKINKKIV